MPGKHFLAYNKQQLPLWYIQKSPCGIAEKKPARVYLSITPLQLSFISILKAEILLQVPICYFEVFSSTVPQHKLSLSQLILYNVPSEAPWKP